MLSRGQNGRDIMQMVWLEDLVPKDHLLRKIDAAVNFDKTYEMVEELSDETSLHTFQGLCEGRTKTYLEGL